MINAHEIFLTPLKILLRPKLLIPMFCCLLFLTSVAQASSFKAALKETKRNLKSEEVSEAYQNIRPHLTGLEKRDKR